VIGSSMISRQGPHELDEKWIECVLAGLL